MNLNPPATLKPGIGGAPKASTCASLTCRAQIGRSRAMIASSLSSRRPRRFSNGSRVMNIEPKLEPLADCTKEKPATVRVWATPGCCRAIFSICARASSVRCNDAESGNWMPARMRP